MPVGKREKAQAHSPLFTRFSSSAVPRISPHEVNALAGARVVNAEKRAEHVLLQQGHVELLDQFPRGREEGLEEQ